MLYKNVTVSVVATFSTVINCCLSVLYYCFGEVAVIYLELYFLFGVG